MNSKEHLKKIYVIHCIITNPVTNTINDSLLLATEDPAVADYLIGNMEQELKTSVTNLATMMISLHCNIPADLQESENRDNISKENIKFYKTSILLSKYKERLK